MNNELQVTVIHSGLLSIRPSMVVCPSVLPSVSRSVSHSVRQAVSQAASHSVRQPVSQSVSQSLSQAGRLSGSQSLSEAASQLVSQFVPHSVDRELSNKQVAFYPKNYKKFKIKSIKNHYRWIRVPIGKKKRKPYSVPLYSYGAAT